ncbi:lipopolysaccharide assembly protein LapA domain-containing protein [Novosphingobium terrae]|jgi:lipopolysaccharide assembly protein A|uniref:lipopolysaccharide assembly protein LapA domain-containing protein n=1 Tax=Novosphingobium terrae TaxID=2726189 RepID=UPI00197E7BB2|nr:lipopolysaccharide assembly protein LapA domain-containing protein [Novosphingobium terrae]
MQFIRTALAVIAGIVLLIFSVNNWKPVEVRIWDTLVLDTKLPAVVVVSFLLGLVPMWLISKAGRWRLKRRIQTLENAVLAASQTVITPSVPAPAPEPVPAADNGQ